MGWMLSYKQPLIPGQNWKSALKKKRKEKQTIKALGSMQEFRATETTF